MKEIELFEIDIYKQKQNDANHFSLIYHITDTETGEVIEETIPNIEIKLPIEVSEIPEVSYRKISEKPTPLGVGWIALCV